MAFSKYRCISLKIEIYSNLILYFRIEDEVVSCSKIAVNIFCKAVAIYKVNKTICDIAELSKYKRCTAIGYVKM